MKLTNAMKDAIINAVMSDTPETYSLEDKTKDITELCVKLLPSDVRKIWDNKETREWVRLYYVCSGYYPLLNGPTDEMKSLEEKYKSSQKARYELKSHVRNVVYQFSTDKQMRELLPELDKYIPKVQAVAKNLPVANSLMAELSKAGFPRTSK